ncbi:MAG: hypothetical protein EA352_02485 [Gemmatimonadales bacterium]|nr:MAG: hypothetical protein EA352_02485 [Gemmatimonadales bacterium]
MPLLRRLWLPTLVLLAAGCELGEVTVADPEQVMVAEVWLRSGPEGSSGVGLIYRTPGPERGELEGGGIRIIDEDGNVRDFGDRLQASECTEGRFPSLVEAACFILEPEEAEILVPGATYQVEVDLPGGGVLEGVTTLPGAFEMVQPVRRGISCNLPSETPLPLAWTQASGVWSYIPEAEISGLPAALAPRGIVVPTDPVTLLGLSISQADTTIAFPGEFGLFNRFSGDRDLLVALQDGLPAGAGVTGQVVVAAQDRNATNWLRGGPFNPSGTVRIPSLFGDGTGVAGGVVTRGFTFRVDDSAFPPCLPPA